MQRHVLVHPRPLQPIEVLFRLLKIVEPKSLTKTRRFTFLVIAPVVAEAPSQLVTEANIQNIAFESGKHVAARLAGHLHLVTERELNSRHHGRSQFANPHTSIFAAPCVLWRAFVSSALIVFRPAELRFFAAPLPLSHQSG